MKKLLTLSFIFLNSTLFGQISTITDSTGAITILPTGIKSKYSGTEGLGPTNTAIGNNSLMSLLPPQPPYNIESTGNVAIGYGVMPHSTLAIGNVGIGYKALNSHISGQYNVAIGNEALVNNIDGRLNVAIGSSALFSNTTGRANVALGVGSLTWNSTGYNNVGIGYDALYGSEGSNNIGIGEAVMFTSGNGSNNIGVGSFALVNNKGNSNIAIGENALNDNLGANYNVAIGKSSLEKNTTGQSNVSIGVYSMPSKILGHSNVSIGSNTASHLVTGSNNVAIGLAAMSLAHIANNSVFIGNYANLYAQGNTNNCIVIGHDARVNGDNKIRLGNNAITHASTQVAWTVSSDKRWKENIKKLDLGLAFIKDLNPVSYNRKNQETPQKEFGLIAQDLVKILDKHGYNENVAGLVSSDSEGYYSVRYNDLIPALIRALQEQQEQIESQNMEIEQLKKLNNKLRFIETRLENLEKNHLGVSE